MHILNRLGFLLRDTETRAGRLTNATLYVLNLLFLLLYILSTYSLPDPYPTLIQGAELALAFLFLGEYFVRLSAAESMRSEITNPYTLVDLLAIVPVFVGLGVNAGFLRGLHALRIFRFLRLLVNERQFLGRSVRTRTIHQIELSVTIFLIFFISTGFIYAAESSVNEQISNFGDAFYYTVIAISTVGFGDIVPQTLAGRWITVITVLVGFILVPWQASRLRTVTEVDKTACPRCDCQVDQTDRYCRQCSYELVTDEPDGVGTE